MPENAQLISLYVKTGEKSITSQIVDINDIGSIKSKAKQTGLPLDVFTVYCDGSFSLAIGRVCAGKILKIQIKYIHELSTSLNSSKIILPSFIGLDFQALYDVNFKIKYLPDKAVKNITSSTHNIKTEFTENLYYIYSDKKASASDDIVIKITFDALSSPFVYYNDKYCCWCFTPKFLPHKRQNKPEYLFLLDNSDCLSSRQFDKVKKALLACIHGLQENDRFNIIAFDTLCNYFSLKSQPLSQVSLESATRWLSQLKPMSDAFLMTPLRHIYDIYHKNCVVILITSGKIADKEKAVSFLRKQKINNFFVLGLNSFYMESVVEITRSANGYLQMLQNGQRIEDAVVKLFHKAMSDSSEISIMQTGSLYKFPFSQTAEINSGEPILIITKRMDQIPTELTISGKHYEENITFKKCNTMLEMDTIYYFARIQSLLHKLYLNNKNKLIKNEIKNISLKNNMLTPLTALTVNMHIANPQGEMVDIKVPAYYTNKSIKNEDDFVTSLINRQNADGSFGNGGMIEVASELLLLIDRAENPFLYHCQIKKSIEYLFSLIEKGDYEVIPKEVITLFDIWCKHFAKGDKLAKKIEAIVYINRDFV
jgi:hypothetical protein